MPYAQKIRTVNDICFVRVWKMEQDDVIVKHPTNMILNYNNVVCSLLFVINIKLLLLIFCFTQIGGDYHAQCQNNIELLNIVQQIKLTQHNYFFM